MKKIISIIAVSALFFSCKKDNKTTCFVCTTTNKFTVKPVENVYCDLSQAEIDLKIASAKNNGQTMTCK